jgi:hypothetical protein
MAADEFLRSPAQASITKLVMELEVINLEQLFDHVSSTIPPLSPVSGTETGSFLHGSEARPLLGMHKESPIVPLLSKVIRFSAWMGSFVGLRVSRLL